MKTLIVLMTFAMASCQAQTTVTEDLIEAQSELTIGHEFSELFLAQNRGRLSNYLKIMEEQILDSFMDAYATIKTASIVTRELMAEFTDPSVCKDNVRDRWELQVTRYGQKLSQCLDVGAK